MTLARNIKERALFEGFNKVGIVGAQSLADEGRRLKEWLARGYHGEMGWMARDVEKRVSPLEIFPQAPGTKFSGGKAASVTFAVACGPLQCSVDFQEHQVKLTGRG